MKFKEIKQMTKEERTKKLKDLKLELVKSRVSATDKKGAKTKDIKKVIARILAFNNLENKSGKLNKT